MKKLIAIILALVMALSLVACAGNNDAATDNTPAADVPADDTSVEAPADDEADASEEAPSADTVTVMSHEEYMAAEMDSEVVVEFYVQGAQGWWYDDEAGHGKITVYGQDEVGGYFVYEMNCPEEDAAKLVPGTKIRVTGYKTEWSGEVEIVDATCEIIEGDTYVAEPLDVTTLLGTEEMINHQNMLVSFDDVVIAGVEFKNGEPGDDIYISIAYEGATYDFCIERYLTGPDTEVYQTASALEVFDVVDIEGFLYWYEGVNTHITGITVVDHIDDIA